MDVVEASNAPINFDVIDNFDFEDPEIRSQLKKNETILVGNIGNEGGTSDQVENVALYKYLDLFVKGKKNNF